MEKTHAVYGIITCGNAWWLLRRSARAVSVADPFCWSTEGEGQPTVVAAVLWLVRKAQEELAQRAPIADFLPESTTGGDDGEEVSIGDDDEEDYPPAGVHLREGGSVDSTPHDILEGRLHLETRPPIGTGWSGDVCLGNIRGRAAAIKLARKDEEQGQALLAEAENYLKLRKLWGTYVPRMLSYGTTCNGEMVFLATELLPGVPLDDTPKGELSTKSQTLMISDTPISSSTFSIFLASKVYPQCGRAQMALTLLKVWDVVLVSALLELYKRQRRPSRQSTMRGSYTATSILGTLSLWTARAHPGREERLTPTSLS